MRLASEMSGQRGDDLEDDFVPDELVASSGEEDGRTEAVDGIEGLLSADEDAEQEEAERRGKAALSKRKRKEREKERRAKVCSIPSNQPKNIVTDSHFT